MKWECSISRDCRYYKKAEVLKVISAQFSVDFPSTRTRGRKVDKQHSSVFRCKTPERTFEATGSSLAPIVSPRKEYNYQNQLY